MPESRDRLSRPDNTALMFSHPEGRLFWPSRFSNGDGQSLFRYPLQWGTTPMTDSREIVTWPMGMAASLGIGLGRTGYGAPRLGYMRGRSSYGSLSKGRENIPAGTSLHVRRRAPMNSPLPSWYQRTPRRDITAIVRAIERRTRLGEFERLRFASHLPSESSVLDPSLPILSAHLEHTPMISRDLKVAIKSRLPSVGHLPKILLGIDSESSSESNFHTPQNKLLNSIDQVGVVVMEEFRKIKRMPTAKNAAREKKVCMLMSMR